MDEIIGTADLEKATGYIDEVIGLIRDARDHGLMINVEETTMMLLAGATNCCGTTPDRIIIAQQSLLLAICLQRLA